MKESIAMIYVSAYAQSYGKELKDEKTRLYYYYSGILSCCITGSSLSDFQREIDELKKHIENRGINIKNLADKMTDYAKKMLKSNQTNDDFFILPDAYLEKAKQIAISRHSNVLKPIYLLEVLEKENISWLDLNLNEKIEKKDEPLIHAPLTKAFILNFYDENQQLSYEVHIASNAKEILIGRDLNADIRFNEKYNYISRKHCMITCFNNHYYLQDLGSTQSTYVNDILIGNKKITTKKIELKHGDVIKLSNKINILVSILDRDKLSEKTCMVCQRKFLTSSNEDLCGMCAYEFSKDFGNAPSVQEVSQIPDTFNIENKIYQQKVIQKEGSLSIVFKNNSVNPLPKEKMENDLIPGYELMKVIGEGGMGKVYLVKERKTNKLMALKTIKSDMPMTEIVKKRFEREASLQQQLNHKYIVKQYDYGEYNGMFYILMEYYEHGTLLDYMQFINQQKNKYEILKDLFIQILLGLDYLHHASIKVKLKNGETMQVDGVVHRDIKPQNIFVDFDSKGKMNIKIADFGLAKAYEAAGMSGMSKTGSTMGTIPFMPRQQLIDSKYAKGEVDIWAASAIIYFLGCNAYPKPFAQDKDPFLVCTDEKVVPIKKRNLFFPSKFAKIIDRALDDDCDQLYYQNASDLINDLIKIKV